MKSYILIPQRQSSASVKVNIYFTMFFSAETPFYMPNTDEIAYAAPTHVLPKTYNLHDKPLYSTHIRSTIYKTSLQYPLSTFTFVPCKFSVFSFAYAITNPSHRDPLSYINRTVLPIQDPKPCLFFLTCPSALYMSYLHRTPVNHLSHSRRPVHNCLLIFSYP